MSSIRRRSLGYVGAALLLLLFPLAGAAAAQQGGNNASIIGLVTDESKAVLPGVTVTATSPALQVPNVTVVTDERGEYRLTPLPIGTYTVEYQLAGFQTVRREGIRLTAAFTAKVDIPLAVGSLEETVTVSGQAPIVDATATETVTHITREVLDTIPTGRSGYIGLLQLAPGTRAPLDVGGSTNNQNPTFRAFGMVGEAWQALDGIVTKNPRSSDSGNYFDFNAFEEASVATLGHDASVPNRGVVINSVIKSGGNEFHGGGFYGGTSSALQTNPESGSGNSLTLRDDLNGELGGRIVRNKVWFWLGARNQRNKEEVVGCFKPDGSACEHQSNAKFLTPKVTYQLNPSNKFTGFAALGFRDDVESLGGPLIAWSARRHQTGFQGASKGEWQALKGDNIVIDVMAGLFWNHSQTVCDEDTCDQISSRDRATGDVWGLINRAGERNREGRRQVRANMTWFRPNWGGNHELKTGFDFFHAPANRNTDDRGAARNYRLNFNRGAPDRIEIWNYPVVPNNAIKQIYGYVADSWTIGRKLTLNLGLRYGYESAFETPGCRDAAAAPFDALYPDMCWDRLQMPIFHSVVPRLRAVYDLSGDGKTVVKGGWGRYMSLRLFDYMQPMLHNVPTTSTFRWRDLNGNRNWDPGESNLNVNGSDFLSLSLAGQFTALGQGIVNPNETQPYTDEYSLQFERQLGSDLAMRVTGVQTRARNQYRLANDLRPSDAYTIPIRSTDPGPDGVVGSGDDPGNVITWFDYPSSLAGLAFQRGMIVNDDSANQVYNSMELALSKRLSRDFQFQVTYTATRRNVPLEANADIWNTQDPNAEIFAENKNWEWQSRVTGSYLFRYGILASANFEHRSGDPWARTALLSGGTQIPDLTVRVEPIGTRRLPHINLLNLRAEKRFALRGQQQLQLRTNVFNVLNTNVATAVNPLSGSTFGVVTDNVLPRIVNFEVQFRF